MRRRRFPKVTVTGVGCNRFYKTIGKCIYCGAFRYDSSRSTLGTEHVIPFSLNGNLILREASCQKCEQNINKFEQTLNREVYGPIRYHLGLKTRRPSERPECLTVELIFADGSRKSELVPIQEFPVILGTWIIDHPPEILSMTRKDSKVVISLLCPLGVEQTNIRRKEIAIKFSASQCELKTNVHNRLLTMRLAAKIAHGFAVACLGPDAFVPALPAFILGRNEQDGEKFVGGLEIHVGNSMLHHLELYSVLSSRLGNALMVGVRLFSHFGGAPNYLVMVGWLNGKTVLPPQSYIEPLPSR